MKENGFELFKRFPNEITKRYKKIAKTFDYYGAFLCVFYAEGTENYYGFYS